MTGTIYFIQCGRDGGPIKIGFSTQIDIRIVDLQGWSPFELILLASAPGTIFDERAIHNEFVTDWIRGEWFRPSVRLFALMGEVNQSGEIPQRLRGGRGHPHLIGRNAHGRKPWSEKSRNTASISSKKWRAEVKTTTPAGVAA